MNRNLKQYKKSDFKPGYICTMHQELLMKALIKSKWNVKQAIGLNYDENKISLNYYYQILEAYRICLKLKRVI